jgi:hypothetical protein
MIEIEREERSFFCSRPLEEEEEKKKRQKLKNDGR